MRKFFNNILLGIWSLIGGSMIIAMLLYFIWVMWIVISSPFQKCSDKRKTIEYHTTHTEYVCSKIDTAFSTWDWYNIHNFDVLPDSIRDIYLNRVYDNIIQYDSIFLNDEDYRTVLVSGDRFSHRYLYEWPRFSVRKNGKELSIDIDDDLQIMYFKHDIFSDYDFWYSNK